MHGPREPRDLDIASNPFQLPTPVPGDMRIDPFKANNEYRPYPDEKKAQLEDITPTRSRFNLPNFQRDRSDSANGSHRVNHPRGDDDEQESMRLVRNESDEEDGGDYAGGEILAEHDSREQL